MPEYDIDEHLRVCAHCEFEFFSDSPACPRCGYGSFSLSWVSGAPIVSDSFWILRRDQSRKRRGADYHRQVYLAFQPTRHPDVCTCFNGGN
jgi:hypothetical protein